MIQLKENIINFEVVVHAEKNFSQKTICTFLEAFSTINSKDAQCIINLAKTEYINSSALGMLVNLKQYLGNNQSAIRFVNANSYIKKLFKSANLDSAFPIEYQY
ncbi:STAS domain-containing protein [Spartinivicinus ruber]|uniref:STAS domain-containing protein n=1 Tax=Spartinivicinus ruber TaxID=2683272 RepID=UPI0013D8764E|nr:STAS domain-containing protein [Spartinivicinus ruber]